MIIGLISDTHNDIEATERALAIFKERGIAVLIHAGDITSPNMLDYFKNFKCYIVLGNGDIIDKIELNKKAEEFNMGSIEESVECTLEGKSIIVFHGNNVPLFREAVSSGKFDYIVKGHTHFFENYVSNKSRVINPGAVSGNNESTIAILDLESGRVEKIDIGEW